MTPEQIKKLAIESGAYEYGFSENSIVIKIDQLQAFSTALLASEKSKIDALEARYKHDSEEYHAMRQVNLIAQTCVADKNMQITALEVRNEKQRGYIKMMDAQLVRHGVTYKLDGISISDDLTTPSTDILKEHDAKVIAEFRVKCKLVGIENNLREGKREEIYQFREVTTLPNDDKGE